MPTHVWEPRSHVRPGHPQQDSTPSWPPIWTAAEPLVLVLLGTLHAGSDAFFRTCFDVLADLPARVLLAAGSHTDPAARPAAGEHAGPGVRPPAGGAPSDGGVRHHGGRNSALEGPAGGVPLVVIPQQFEQLVIGQAIADRGAAVVLGHNLSNRPVPPDQLRAAVELTLTVPSRRTSAKALADTFGDGGGATQAARWSRTY